MRVYRNRAAHFYCIVYFLSYRLTLTHNAPPTEANKRRKKGSGVTPEPPIGGSAPCTPELCAAKDGGRTAMATSPDPAWKANNELRLIGEALMRISRVLHEHTRKLELAVEG